VRSKCFRFRAKWGPRQSLAPFDGGEDCPHFWSLDDETRIVSTGDADARLKSLDRELSSWADEISAEFREEVSVGRHGDGTCNQCGAPVDRRHKMSCYGGTGGLKRERYWEREAVRLTQERDEARRMLGECYVLSGADTDGNEPGSGHLWPYAVQEVRQLRQDYDEALDEDEIAATKLSQNKRVLAKAVERAARYRALLEMGLNLPKRTPRESLEAYAEWEESVRKALSE
jgi:hypothetical protein